MEIFYLSRIAVVKIESMHYTVSSPSPFFILI